MPILSRIQNLKHNFAIVDALTEIAKCKGITSAQLSIAWVSARGPHIVPLPGSSCVNYSGETFTLLIHAVEIRSAHQRTSQGGGVELSSKDLSEIDRVLSSHVVKGGRYVDAVPDEKLYLWG
ncbi:hypothetical protein EDB85DRAFT_1864516 [Lactarius pseudohatsudake]|nr:hypothetical protein EDB85DRAFT_1864516 [Lactarius pseudohatsudake]